MSCIATPKKDRTASTVGLEVRGLLYSAMIFLIDMAGIHDLPTIDKLFLRVPSHLYAFVQSRRFWMVSRAWSSQLRVCGEPLGRKLNKHGDFTITNKRYDLINKNRD